MLRRFNYTDRVRLLHSDLRFSLKQVNGMSSFDAALDLEEYDLPPDALIFVEAYRQTGWMRFPWGAVGAQQPADDRNLTDFDSPEDLLFRVRVTSSGLMDDEHGLLLAEADRIRMRGPEETNENRDPLLPVIPADLGHQLWRVDFSEKPRLLINRNAGSDYKQVGRHPAFVSLVYPAAMRDVLTHILLVLKLRDYDEEEPYSRWLRFAVEVLGMREPPDEDGDHELITDWIDDAVDAFARKHQFTEKFCTFWAKEETS